MKKISLLFVIFLASFFHVYANLSILLVHDNGTDTERVEKIKTAISAAGYDYSCFDAVALQASPTQAMLEAFDLVIWYTGNDSNNLWFWNGNDTENEALKAYLENGGMLWVQGLDWLFDKYGTGPALFSPGDYLYDYFGIYTYYGQSYVNDGGQGVPQLDAQSGNDIFSLNTLYWQYSTMWYVDALIGTNDAQYLYEMGPASYVLSGFYPAIFNENGDTKVISFAFETARLDSQSHLNQLIADGLDYFDDFGTGITVPLESVEVYSPGGDTAISEQEGTLQLAASFAPANASIPFVIWEVIPGTATADITQNGLLQANGLNNGNLWVKITSLDGTNLTDSIEINISGQGEGDYAILLVNDNANTPQRYLAIDSTLNNLGVNYSIFDAVSENSYPSYLLLSGFDMVIWYTGNDGVNLFLWDVSNPDAPVFNEPLKQYLDNGGTLWLQGLDFLYDVYGGAPETFEEGDFVYDYLGIQAYAAQSKVDDGGLGVSQMDVVSNDICTYTPVQWVWETLWYADGLILRPEATPIYKMGPAGYVLGNYHSGLYFEKDEAEILTFTFATAKIDSQENRDAFFLDVLDYFDPQVATAKHRLPEDAYGIYPNPVVSTLTIDPGEHQTTDVSLYDMTGKEVWKNALRQKTTFSVKDLGLENGLYLLRLSSGKKISSRKILIK